MPCLVLRFSSLSSHLVLSCLVFSSLVFSCLVLVLSVLVLVFSWSFLVLVLSRLGLLLAEHVLVSFSSSQAMMGLISYFFSGFVLVKVPFPLSKGKMRLCIFSEENKTKTRHLQLILLGIRPGETDISSPILRLQRHASTWYRTQVVWSTMDLVLSFVYSCDCIVSAFGVSLFLCWSIKKKKNESGRGFMDKDKDKAGQDNHKTRQYKGVCFPVGMRCMPCSCSLSCLNTKPNSYPILSSLESSYVSSLSWYHTHSFIPILIPLVLCLSLSLSLSLTVSLSVSVSVSLSLSSSSLSFPRLVFVLSGLALSSSLPCFAQTIAP
jgi:hypothetical protein